MKKTPYLILSLLLLISCVGEDLVNDYVDPDLRISNAILSISEGFQYQFKARFFDESGTKVENPTLVWRVDPPSAASITQDGTIKAITAGQATVIIQTTGLQGNIIEARSTFTITAVANTETTTTETSTMTTDTETSTMTTDTETSTMTTDTETSTMTTDTETSTMTTDTETSTMTGVVVAPQYFEGEIHSTSSYALEGKFRYEHDGTRITLSLDSSYRASTSLPGLYIYLGNNPRTVNGAFEIGEVKVFSGAHQYVLPPSIELTDYKYIIYWCKPFSVPVGEGQIF